MSAKEKRKLSTVVSILCVMFVALIVVYIKFINNKETYATKNLEEPKQEEVLKISNNQGVDLDEIIANNTNKKYMKEEIYEKQEELEYITKYRNNSELYQGTTQVSQEGRNGIQTIIMKKTYNENGDVVKDEQVACVVTKSSINKIIDIGTKVYVEPKKANDEIGSSHGLAFDMKLNQPSGFSLEQLSAKLLLIGINIPVTSLHRIENNQRTVRDYEICAFSIVLNVSVSELLDPITKRFKVS